MSYGQQPNDGNQWNQPTGGVPPVPQAPTQPPSAPQQYGAPMAPQYGAPQYGAPQYGAPQAYGQYGAAPGAPWAGPNVAMPRPGTVTAGAVLAFIGGGFMVLVGGIIAIAGGIPEVQEAIESEYGAGFGNAAIAVGVGVLLFGALVIFLGVMAIKGRRWAAIGLAVLAGLSVLGGITNLASGAGSSLVGVAWSVASAVLLLVPTSQAWCRSRQGR